MRIGIYGGTFNPPHLGHMVSARAAMEALGLDRLFFIPAATPPHKHLPPDGADAPDRLAMTAMMADGLGMELGRSGEATALDMELRRKGPSYTADTVEELQARYPQDELWFLMGEDMFLSFHTWRWPERITALARIAAFAREREESGDAMEAQAEYLRKTYGARVRVLRLPQVIEISSTQLRGELATGGGGDLLWCQVYGYILRKRLYGVERDLRSLNDGDLRAVSYSMVKAGRVRHIAGTETAAVALARRWGADVERARRAAILHDCTKYLSGEEQLALCAKYGETLTELERAEPKILHAKTGAWIARDLFGVDDEIFSAIYWHTVGRAGMTLLEKVIYLADYTEPGRRFPGVEELRALAQEDLDGALCLGFEMTIRELEERGLSIHLNTAEALRWLIQTHEK